MGTPCANRGFTLLEMLVALTIFTVIGLLSAQLMSRTLDNHETAGERSERLAEMPAGDADAQARHHADYRSADSRHPGG